MPVGLAAVAHTPAADAAADRPAFEPPAGD
jgi:hypothetical protein